MRILSRVIITADTIYNGESGIIVEEDNQSFLVHLDLGGYVRFDHQDVRLEIQGENTYGRSYSHSL